MEHFLISETCSILHLPHSTHQLKHVPQLCKYPTYFAGKYRTVQKKVHFTKLDGTLLPLLQNVLFINQNMHVRHIWLG